MKYQKYRKYKARKTDVDGYTFDSKKEARRYKELRALEDAGEISNLKLQVPFVLIPTQREKTDAVYKKGKNKGEKKPGKVLEREVKYIADFVYEQNGKKVVEDCKGFRTTEYIIKRKLMLMLYGILIKET